MPYEVSEFSLIYHSKTHFRTYKLKAIKESPYKFAFCAERSRVNWSVANPFQAESDSITSQKGFETNERTDVELTTIKWRENNFFKWANPGLFLFIFVFFDMTYESI